MSSYYAAIEALLEPGETEALPGGRHAQLVTVRLSDSEPPARPARTSLRPGEARTLALRLLALAEQAERARPR